MSSYNFRKIETWRFIIGLVFIAVILALPQIIFGQNSLTGAGRISRSWQEIRVKNISSKAMVKIDAVANFAEAGLTPRAVSAGPEVGVDFNNRTVTASVRSLRPGESMILKVLVSGPSGFLEVPVRVAAVIGGEVARGVYSLPIMVTPAPDSGAPPVAEPPQPPQSEDAESPTDTEPVGGISEGFPPTPIPTEHNPEDSREAAESVMEKIEEGGGLFPPPTPLDRVKDFFKSLWPF